MMQLVGHARERLDQIGRAIELEISAAAFIGEQLEARIRLRVRAAAAAAAPTKRTAAWRRTTGAASGPAATTSSAAAPSPLEHDGARRRVHRGAHSSGAHIRE